MRNELALTKVEVMEYFNKQRQQPMQVLMVAQATPNNNNMDQDATK
jgi:hypothetical protein